MNKNSVHKLINLKKHGDERGSLIAIEKNHNVPFEIKRVYYIFDTKKDVRRGFHAHKNLKQLAICVSGTCKFLIDDGTEKTNYELNNANEGLLIEGLLWREMYDFSKNCVLMVLADEYYDEEDYIRDYNKFIKVVNKWQKK